MLKNSFSARLLKKVQVQGGVRCEVRGVLGPYVAAPRERAGYPSGGWVPQMGLFQQPEEGNEGSDEPGADPFPEEGVRDSVLPVGPEHDLLLDQLP